jgi:FkbM family methyltransferase
LLRARGFDVVRYPTPSLYEYHLRELLRVLEIDCVFDVGAAAGQSGQQLRSWGFKGRIVSFEPIPAQVENIRRIADKDWHVEQLAVGAVRELRNFNINADEKMSSFLGVTDYALDTQPNRVRLAETQEVQVAPLDELLDRFVAPNDRLFLKLDAQGYEGEILRGGERTLERALGMQIELSLIAVYRGQPDYLTLLAELKEKGFHPTWFSQFPTHPDLKLVEMDCLLRRE